MIGMEVSISYLDFGIGVVSVPIGVTQIDLGVKGGPGCPAFATMPWRSPSAPGHYCLQVGFEWFDDANPLNNLGQENLVVGRASSPAEFGFTLGNRSADARTFAFEVDTYELRRPSPCQPTRQRTDAGRRVTKPRTRSTQPDVPDDVRARHRRADHPIPPGWSIRFDPDRPALAPDESTTVTVWIEPPTGFIGSQRFNVHGVDGDFLAGGITLVVEAS